MADVVDLIVDRDERVGEGGFLSIRRLALRNRREDFTVSRAYTCDAIVRSYGQDAVVVAIYAKIGRSWYVLVRDGLRPAVTLGRDPLRAPLPERKPALFQTELVAGIIEDDDRGEAGLRARAAAEALEEAGYIVDPAKLAILGAGSLPSPGCLVEKYYFCAVEVEPSMQQPIEGDGSPMEESARTRWLPLDDAIAACTRGDIPDLKTELGLRRLRDHLAV